MNRKQIACAATILGLLVAVSRAEAQTFLQKLGQQLQLNPPAPAPAPTTTPAQPIPPPPDDNLPAPRDRESVPTNSSSRASLGIRVGPVTEDVVRDQGLIVRRGAVINAIEKGSAADRAGLPLGAIIVAMDGRRIDSPADLAQSVQAARAGQDVELSYYDQNKLARKKVHLAAVSGSGFLAVPNQPANQAAGPATPPPAVSPPGSGLERELGGGGSRPLLGKIGRVIDGIAGPTPAAPPADSAVTNRVDPDSEIALLRQQLADLTKQVEALSKQVSSLEQKISSKK